MSFKEYKMKISVSQCMAEILCSPCYDSHEFSEAWNKIPEEYRNEIVDNLKEYLVSCVGKNMVDK